MPFFPYFYALVGLFTLIIVKAALNQDDGDTFGDCLCALFWPITLIVVLLNLITDFIAYLFVGKY